MTVSCRRCKLDNKLEIKLLEEYTGHINFTMYFAFSTDKAIKKEVPKPVQIHGTHKFHKLAVKHTESLTQSSGI